MAREQTIVPSSPECRQAVEIYLDRLRREGPSFTVEEQALADLDDVELIGVDRELKVFRIEWREPAGTEAEKRDAGGDEWDDEDDEDDEEQAADPLEDCRSARAAAFYGHTLEVLATNSAAAAALVANVRGRRRRPAVGRPSPSSVGRKHGRKKKKRKGGTR